MYPFSNILLTVHLMGLNSKGFSWRDGSRCTAVKIGNTFHPFGITYSAFRAYYININLTEYLLLNSTSFIYDDRN